MKSWSKLINTSECVLCVLQRSLKKHYQLNFYIWYRGISTFVKDATALQLLVETIAGVQSLDSKVCYSKLIDGRFDICLVGC